MYRAIGQGTIRFNPVEEGKYEAVERKPRFLSKSDVAKLLAFPLQDEGAELSRRMFLFSVFTGLAFVDLPTCRAYELRKLKRTAKGSGISARQDRKRKLSV